MRVLVLCGDNAHPVSLTRDGLLGLRSGPFEFEFLEDPGDWSRSKMDDYPLIVFSKANQRTEEDPEPWATEEIGKDFVDYVRQGNGLLVLHSGTALYDECPSLCSLMGGVFAGHPAPCPVTVEPHVGHDLVIDSVGFTLLDEHYQMTMSDPDVDLFLEASSEHGVQPAGWTRREGKGRVCVLVPGHFPNIWSHRSYQVLLRNTLNWCVEENEWRKS